MKIFTIFLVILLITSCTETTEYIKTCEVKTYLDYKGGVSTREIFDNNSIRVGTHCPF